MKRGFTLIEVMVAMGILALMSVLAYSSLSQVAQGTEDVEKMDLASHSVALAMDKMNQDLSMAFLVLSSDFLGSDGRMKAVFVGNEDRIHFPSFSRTRYFQTDKELDYGEIGYSIDIRAEEGEGKILFRREADLDQNPEEGGTPEALIDKVIDFKLEYYDGKKKEWVKSWDSSQVEFVNRLPRAVRISLEVQGSSEEEILKFSTVAEVKLYDQPINF